MKQVFGLICANYSPDYMGDIVKDRPIAALPFGGRYRLIDFALSNMTNMGIQSVGVVMASNYRPIIDHISSGKAWGLDRKREGLFILPGANFGARFGAVKFLMGDIIRNQEYLIRANEQYIIISSANQVFNMDYEELARAHIARGADVTLVYKKTSGYYVSDEEKIFLTLNSDGMVSGFGHSQIDEKDNLFCDLLIMNKNLLMDLIDWYKEVPYIDLMEVIEQNHRTIRINAFETDCYLKRIDSVKEYYRTNMDLLKKEVRKELFQGDRKIYTKVRDNPPTKYETGCHVSNTLVANGCVIYGTVENSIISRRNIIEKGAVVKNSILMQGTIVRAGAVVENVISDKYAEIHPGSVIKGRTDKPIYLPKTEKF